MILWTGVYISPEADQALLFLKEIPHPFQKSRMGFPLNWKNQT